MKPSELVNAACKAQGATRYKLHKQYGLPEQSLSNWAQNRSWPDNNAVLILAEAAGLDPWETICELEHEKTEDEAKRSRWAGFLTAARERTARLAADAAQGLKVGVLGFLAPAVCGVLLTGTLAGEAKASEGERLYEKPVSHNRRKCHLFAELRRRTGNALPLVRVLHGTRTIFTRAVALVTQAPKPAF